MLYNIVPPIIFFAAFGGIIVLVSRVVMRTRRQELSQTMHMQTRSSSSATAANLLNPGRGGVELLKNRVSAAANNVRQSIVGAKTYWQTRQERKAEQQALAEMLEEHAVPMNSEQPSQAEPAGRSGGINIPVASWREKTAGLLKRTTENVRQAAQSVRGIAKFKIRQPKTTSLELHEPTDAGNTVPTKHVAAAVPATAAPQIRIIRVESPVSKSEKTAQPGADKAVSANAKPAEISPQGRFVARLKKAEPPKPSTLESAQKALNAGEYEQAEELLVPYIVDHARDCRAYILLGKVAAARGSWEEAMEIFEQAVRLEPDKADTQAGLGHAALQQGKFTIALRALQRAHTCNPTDIGILHEILDIARRLDNKILQKSTLEQLVELKPQDKNIAQALAHLKAKESSHA